MKRVFIKPSSLSGEITIPPSESAMHVSIICAALTGDICYIDNVQINDHVMATLRAICSFGCKLSYSNKRLMVDARNFFRIKDAIVNCAYSTSTLALMLPILAALDIHVCFNGSVNLPTKNFESYATCLQKAGVELEAKNKMPFQMRGQLLPGDFVIGNDMDSDFVSGLMLALPLLNSDSNIILPYNPKPFSSFDFTLNIIKHFGVNIVKQNNGFYIPGRQVFKRNNFLVEGDWSKAAFFIAAGAIGTNKRTSVAIKGLQMDSLQNDIVALSIFEAFGTKLQLLDDTTLLVFPGHLKAITYNASDNPNLVPVVAITAMFAKGETRIIGANKLFSQANELITPTSFAIGYLGGNIRTSEDGFNIVGTSNINGKILESYGDYKIIMALSIAAIRAKSEIVINDCDSIIRSYPGFFEDYNRLGGMAHIMDI